MDPVEMDPDESAPDRERKREGRMVIGVEAGRHVRTLHTSQSSEARGHHSPLADMLVAPEMAPALVMPALLLLMPPATVRVEPRLVEPDTEREEPRVAAPPKFRVEYKNVAPDTPSVPAMPLFPVSGYTKNLSELIAKKPVTPRLPAIEVWLATASEEERVVAPPT